MTGTRPVGVAATEKRASLSSQGRSCRPSLGSRIRTAGTPFDRVGSRLKRAASERAHRHGGGRRTRAIYAGRRDASRRHLDPVVAARPRWRSAWRSSADIAAIRSVSLTRQLAMSLEPCSCRRRCSASAASVIAAPGISMQSSVDRRERKAAALDLEASGRPRSWRPSPLRPRRRRCLPGSSRCRRLRCASARRRRRSSPPR